MSELYHYGIKGQKHGVRKYQNEDGSLTPEGKIHYGIGDGRKSKVIFKPGEKSNNIVKTAIEQTKNDFKNDMKSKKPTKKVSRNVLFRPARSKTEKQARRNLKIAAGIFGTAAVIHIARSVISNYKDKKASEAADKKYYNTVIESTDWATIGKLKLKDIGYDQDWADEWRRERS